jgi:hypothetical protein
MCPHRRQSHRDALSILIFSADLDAVVDAGAPIGTTVTFMATRVGRLARGG